MWVVSSYLLKSSIVFLLVVRDPTYDYEIAVVSAIWVNCPMETYRNIMEFLVEEEVKQQLRAFPIQAAKSIRPVEVVAHALNHLPVLYATSREGFEHQCRKGKRNYGAQIEQVVRQAMNRVQAHPLQHRTPLRVQQKSGTQQQTLTQLKTLLQNEKITWHTLPAVVEQALTQAAQGDLLQKGAELKSIGDGRLTARREVSWQEYKRLRKTKAELAQFKQADLKQADCGRSQVGEQQQTSQNQSVQEDGDWRENSLIDRTQRRFSKPDRRKLLKTREEIIVRKHKRETRWENLYPDWHPQ